MTNTEQTFTERMSERYPEGLTGILSIGGTRISYILENHRGLENPGRIDDMRQYAIGVLEEMRGMISGFFELGTQNLVVPLLAYQLFEDSRGPAYAEATTKLMFEMLSDEFVNYYVANGIDPYFAGIDTLLRFPERELANRVASACADFQSRWQYQKGRRKLIWEVAPIPLYSIWRAHHVLGETAADQLEAEMEAAPSLHAIHDILYRYYARAVYGTEIPMPHFYLGNNRNGDIKLRAMLPIALLCGSPTRFFFTPYPTMFTSKETIEHLLHDLAFGKRLRSEEVDYKDRLTREFVELEYQRVLQLSQDPTTTVGLVRPQDAAQQAFGDE